MTSEPEAAPELRFAHNVIEHLGIKLYRNKAGNVLAELVANSWDADAKWVKISVDDTGGKDGNGRIFINDNGHGMSFETIRDQYLHVGKPKRKSAKDKSLGGRSPMGRKGLGKLAPFGIARTVDVVSVSEGKLNWFVLDLDSILKVGPTGNYPPVFHIQDGDLTNEIETGDSYLDGKVNAFVNSLKSEQETENDLPSGTMICLSRIVSNQLPDDAFVAKELGSRFTVILLRPDFKVTVNGNEITKDTALPKFEFKIPDDATDLTEDVGGKPVKYWVGFVGAAEWPADEAGVGIFAHGKIAQTRPYFFNRKGKEVFQRYLYAVVEADWIDEEDEDLISTDRTSIDWSSTEMQDLHEWGNKKVGHWISRYEAFRKEKQDKQVAVQAETLRTEGKVNTYSKAENDQIVGLVSNATREIGKAKEAEKTREELLIAVSKAWINQPTRILLGELWNGLLSKSATPEHLSEIVEKLSLHSVPEKMGLALTFSQRAFALTVLYELVHQRSEINLQELVTEFPWILQPRGDLLTADKTLKTTIDKLATQMGSGSTRVGSIINSMSASQRADFVFLTSADDDKIQIVEIKKPNLILSREEERQIIDYMDFIQESRSNSRITGVLIGNKGDGFEPRDSRITVKSWDEIFAECRAIYVELLASMLHIADIDSGDTRLQVIKDIGGDNTWELLGKLSETDEDLKLLLKRFNTHVPTSA